MIKINLDWTWLEWELDYTWEKNISPQLRDESINKCNLARCVYVIRLNGVFLIDYPKKPSPVLYIGEGNFKDRLACHKNWLGTLEELVQDYSFEIGVAIPRVRNNQEAYKDCEAELIKKFKLIHGSIPMFNKQGETRKNDYIYSNTQVNEAILIGKGVRFS